MRKVAIVTDGSCDLPKSIIDEYNIFVVPFQVVLGNKVFQMHGDSGNITKDEFYNLIDQSKEKPTTSVPAPKTFFDTYQSALNEADSVIAIILSHNLSSTFQSANLVLDMFDDEDITIIDSKVAASTLGLLVMEAANMAKNGRNKREIIRKVNKLIPQAQLAGIMENVEATYRSGRIGWGRKFLVEALNIRPIVTFKNGFIHSPGSVRGGRNEILKRMKYLAPIVVKQAITDTIFVWHVRCEKDAILLKDIMEEHNSKNRRIIVQEAGPVIGTHVGKNAVAYMYIGKFDPKWLLKMKE